MCVCVHVCTCVCTCVYVCFGGDYALFILLLLLVLFLIKTYTHCLDKHVAGNCVQPRMGAQADFEALEALESRMPIFGPGPRAIGALSHPFLFWGGEGSLTKMDKTEKSWHQLILTSPLERVPTYSNLSNLEDLVEYDLMPKGRPFRPNSGLHPSSGFRPPEVWAAGKARAGQGRVVGMAVGSTQRCASWFFSRCDRIVPRIFWNLLAFPCLQAS